MSDEAYGTPGGVQAQVAIVRDIYSAFARRDLEGALAHLAEDVELVLPTAQLAGRAGRYRGHAGVRLYFADLARLWDELVLVADDVRATTRGVVVFGHVEGRHGAEEVRRNVIWTWRLRDDLVVSLTVHDIGRT